MIVNGIDISDCPFIDIMKRNKKLKKIYNTTSINYFIKTFSAKNYTKVV